MGSTGSSTTFLTAVASLGFLGSATVLLIKLFFGSSLMIFLKAVAGLCFFGESNFYLVSSCVTFLKAVAGLELLRVDFLKFSLLSSRSLTDGLGFLGSASKELLNFCYLEFEFMYCLIIINKFVSVD